MADQEGRLSKASSMGKHPASETGVMIRRTMSESESKASCNGFKPVIKQGNQDEMDGDQVNLDAIKETLLSGEEEELLIALFETQQILKNCQEFAVQILVPIICEKVTDWNYTIKLSAAEALMAAVHSGIPPSLAKDISGTAFNVINLPCDQAMCEFWGDLLVATLPGVSWSTSKLDEVIDLLEMKYAASGNPLSRQLAARILGSLATCSKDDDLKRRIMDRAIIITNDKDPQVRGMIAESLSSIGASMDVSVVEKDLWPCLLNLLKDDDARIHAASIRTLSVISAAHREKQKSSKLFSELLPPVLLLECATVRRDAAEDLRSIDEDRYLLLEINAQVFGELLYSCCDFFPDDTRKEAFKAFLAMSTCNGPIIRKHCAFNMPAVSLCLSGAYGERLSAVVEYLSRDADVQTRWMLASGMHQTAKILASSETIGNLFNAVHVLLQDSEFVVRNATLEHFEELIVELAKHFGYSSAQKLTPLFENLQLLAKGQWRTQELLARQLKLAAPLVPPPSLKMDVLPMLYQMAEGGASQVRKAAMAAIATCMRYIPDVTERDQVMRTFSVEWAHGTVYWMRIAFIDSAEAAVHIYSKCLFRDTYGSELLRLANDTVPNVRLRTALLIPKVAPACNQMEEFDSAVDALKMDEDKDVFQVMQDVEDRIREAINKGYENFEEDMKLEDEEQQLYSRHLFAQREAQRLKAKTALKRRPGAFLKAAKGLQASTSRTTSPSVLDDAGVATESTNAPLRQSPAGSRKSASFIITRSSGSGTDTFSPSSKKQQTFGKGEKRKKTTSSMISPIIPSSVDQGEGTSPVASSSRAFKGFRSLLASPKHGSGSRRGNRPRKTLT